MTKETSLATIQPSTWPRTKSKNICIIYNCLGCFCFFLGAEFWHVSVHAVAPAKRKAENSLQKGYRFTPYPAHLALKTDLKMKREKDKKKSRTKTLHSLCSVSALLLSVVCCIALIQVELRIQEHHRLISHSVTVFDQMETQMGSFSQVIKRRVFITNAFSLSFYWCQVTLTLSKQDISLRRAVPAGPEGLHQRESWLQVKSF